MTRGQSPLKSDVRNAASVSAAPSRQGARQRPVVRGLFQPLPGLVWAANFVLVLVGLTTQYPLLTVASVLVLTFCASLLWFRGESPILFACCALQWLQVSTAVFFCDFYQVSLEETMAAPEVEQATWLCLAGVFFLAIGMRTMLTSWGRGGDVAEILEAESARLDLVRTFQIWLIIAVLANIAEAVGWRFTAIHQFLMPVSNLKWVFFFMVSYQVLQREQGYGLMGVMMAIEFLSGFMGQFGSFKEGLMMVLITGVTLRRALKFHFQVAALVIVFLGVAASVFWSSVKHDYRVFVTASQERDMSVRVLQRFNWLEDRLARFDSKAFENGTRALVARVQYVSLVGYTLSHVPRFEPHSNGELWLGAVKHVLMPRFIFRDKAVLDDSERARRFTGLRLAGRDEHTSIGIGYMAESYADFGLLGMFVPVYLLGMFMGRAYQVSVRNRHSAMLGTAIGTALLFSLLQSFATSNAKILGGAVVLCLAYWALNKAFGAQVMRWLKGER